jgi:dolichyl-phosphate-mannose-protein mannosyltransferase
MSGKSESARWLRTDSIALLLILAAAIITRFWHLAQPASEVFDERYTVSLARDYLRGLPYSTTHPPLSSLLMALSMKLFGDNPLAWRLPNAVFGVALVGVTYLLGRRMYRSRKIAIYAAAFTVCDGLFLVDSRIALWEVFYLTFAAAAYLALFCFMQNHSKRVQRRALAWMGLALGLCAASKLLIPAVAFALVMVFVWGSLVKERIASEPPGGGLDWHAVIRDCASAFALIGGLSALVYFAFFLPNYWLGWWHGLADQLAYYRHEFEFQRHLARNGHPYASPWWSWPLMLRPIRYWSASNFFMDPQLPVGSIRALGNPIIWWGVVGAVALTIYKAIARRDLSSMFIAGGYAIYLGLWIPITRYQFVYYYMPSLYLGFFALAATVSEVEGNEAARWEPGLLVVVVVAGLVLGWGLLPGLVGGIAFIGTYLILRRRHPLKAGRFVALMFAFAVVAVFAYFFPIWTGVPLSALELKRRMWLRGPGLANWN